MLSLHTLEQPDTPENQLEIQNAYFAWLNSFSQVTQSGIITSYSDLCDGIKLANLLLEVDNEIFDPSVLYAKPQTENQRL